MHIGKEIILVHLDSMYHKLDQAESRIDYYADMLRGLEAPLGSIQEVKAEINKLREDLRK
ncbi:hypothetical protein HN803_02720 [candidate division WWE3 bacterium]|jgi:hypothetical protein|nr:hypothetical protein [candidate division WWE3 bacterium]